MTSSISSIDDLTSMNCKHDMKPSFASETHYHFNCVECGIEGKPIQRFPISGSKPSARYTYWSNYFDAQEIRGKTNMTKAQRIIDFQCESTPRKIWEMDKDTLAQLRNLRDENGRYLWAPEPNYKDMPGTLLGIEISIAKEKCFQLRYDFPDGASHIFEAQFEL